MFSGKEFHNLGAATIEDDQQESWIIWQKRTTLNTRWVNLPPPTHPPRLVGCNDIMIVK